MGTGRGLTPRTQHTLPRGAGPRLAPGACGTCVEWGPWKVLTCALGLAVRVHDDRVSVKENQDHRLAQGWGSSKGYT